MVYATAEQQAKRDELVAAHLAAVPSGLTGYEVARVLRDRLGLPPGGSGGRDNLGYQSLWRLEEAGLARCVREPRKGRWGFRRVWYPA